MLNQITVMGRLTKDPELRYTQRQMPVASFTLACDRDFGEKETDFLDVVAWNKTAEFVHSYFSKGMLVAVTGRLQMRQWTDRNDNKRTSAEIVADHCYFAQSKLQRDEAAYDERPVLTDEDAPPVKPVYNDEYDGELPF